MVSFSSDDKSRVCLKETPGVDSCDYINASFIDVRKTFTHTKIVPTFVFVQGYGERKNAYITTQGTVTSFEM